MSKITKNVYLRDLGTDQLREVYKTLTGKTVKRFESRAAARERVARVVVKRYGDDFTVSSGGDHEVLYGSGRYSFDHENLKFIDGASGPEPRWNAEEPKAEEPKGDRSPVRGRRLGVGKFIRERITAGDDTETILTKVREQFPQSRATKSDVAWNRHKLRTDA